VHDEHDAALWVIAAYLVTVLAASAALYHGVERPAQRWILKRWTSHRSSAPLAARTSAPLGANGEDQCPNIRSSRA
jgi:peptidoglycan/LPS O-acetylase OafA/YrhL